MRFRQIFLIIVSIFMLLVSAAALFGQDNGRQGVASPRGAEDPLLAEARELSEDGKLQDAAEVYTNWLAKNAGHPDFGLILIEAADSQLSVDRALELLRVYTPRVQDPQQRELCRAAQIDLLEMLGRTEQALGLLRSYPPTPQWLYRQAQLLYQEGLTAEAEKSLQQALKALLSDPNAEMDRNIEQSVDQNGEIEARIRLLQARIFVEQERNQDAENLFQLLGAKYGDSALGPAILLAYYEFLLDQGRKQAADEQLETLAGKFPDSPELALARAAAGRSGAGEPNGSEEKICYAPTPSRLLPRDLEDITSTPSPAAESEQPQATAPRSPEAAGNQVEPQYSEAAESQTPPQPSATAESRTQPQPNADVKPPGEVKPSGLANPQAEVQQPGPAALVQTGSFRDRENAEYMVRDLKASGFEAEVVEKQIGGTLYYRVVIGPLMTLEQAQSLLMKLKDSSYEGVLLFPE